MLKPLTRKNLAAAIQHLLTDPNFTCDTETYGLGWMDKAFMVGFGHADGTCYYIRETSPDFEYCLKCLVDALDLSDVRPIFANAKFDLHRLDWACGRRFKNVHDVIVMDQLVHPEEFPHKLKSIGSRLFGLEEADEQSAIIDWFDQHNDGEKEFWKLPDEVLLPYFEQDLMLTRKVFDKLFAEMNAIPKLADVYNTEMKVIDVVTKMEKVGILVDRDYLKKFEKVVNKEMSEQLEDLRKGFSVGADFNFGSSDQLGDLLYNQLGFEVKVKTKKGNPSCDDEALSKMQHPYIQALRDFKLNETYLTKFIEPYLKFSEIDGRMHASFNTNGAVSGRFTCYEPNMQQVMKDPKVLKGLMVTPGKVRGHSDLCQIEMVGAAWYMRDEQMLKSLRSGTDLHKDTASSLFDKPVSEITKRERQIAKGMNFSVVYGCGKAKLAGFLSERTGDHVTLEEADKIRSLYHAKYPGIKRFVYRVMDVIRSRQDRVIKNYFGRRYYIPPQKEYVGVNRLVQGWAADITKQAMVKVSGKLNWTSNYMDVQVHDMIGWECDPKELKDVQHEVEKAMTDWPEFDVPVKVETDLKQTNWEE